MVRSKTIVMRVDPETKQRIGEAALKAGKSITTFVLEAAMRAATRELTAPRRQYKGVPKYFGIRCSEAQRGGSGGYEAAGYQLAMHVHTEHPLEGTLAEWQNECAQLCDLCRSRDDEDVWTWFADHYPRCMELVPDRRRDQFLKGVYKAYEDGRMS